MYAQRAYANTFQFDPADPSWEQHDRPWDFDHIMPASYVVGSHNNNRETVAEFTHCIGNLRLCERGENRSDQADHPSKKIKTARSEINSFMIQGEAVKFDIFCDKRFDVSAMQVFIDVTRERLVRIYHEWWRELDISYLVCDLDDPVEHGPHRAAEQKTALA